MALCPDCAVDVGQPHDDGCDVARCLVSGKQRLVCGEAHDCGRDLYRGISWSYGPPAPFIWAEDDHPRHERTERFDCQFCRAAAREWAVSPEGQKAMTRADR